MKVAYLGDTKSHTYKASSLMYGESNEFIGFATARECIQSCERGQIDTAVVPIENSVEGVVSETQDALSDYGVFVTKEIVCAISHNLIGTEKTNKSKVSKIYSHPQALSQCREYLEKNFPNASRIAVSSTSNALTRIHNDDSVAIAGDKLDNQIIIDSDIQDYKTNQTRFISVQRTPVFSGKKCSVVFSVHNKPGQLLRVLQIFADNELNLVKIESRPAKSSLGKYIFYIDFTFTQGKEKLNEFLSVLQNATRELKFLGLY